MGKIKAILIDDEAGAREVLNNLLTRFCKDVEIVAEANNLMLGVEKIKEFKPDVVFLDIQMPKYAGYEIVNFIDNIDFSIVFVTAYDKYALKAFDVSALDYILKPIDVDRLKTSVKKVSEKQHVKIAQEQYSLLNETITQKKISKITITDKGENLFINIEDILAIEGQSAYCKIYLTNKKQYILSRNLKQTAALLEDWNCFFRSHKSWLINTKYVTSYSKSKAEITLSENIVAKLSRYKKTEFEQVCAL